MYDCERKLKNRTQIGELAERLNRSAGAVTKRYTRSLLKLTPLDIQKIVDSLGSIGPNVYLIKENESLRIETKRRGNGGHPPGNNSNEE